MVEESKVLVRDLTKFIDDAEATVNNYKGTVESAKAGNSFDLRKRIMLPSELNSQK